MVPEQFLYVARAYSLLSELDPGQLRKVVMLAEERRFRAGQLIFREHEECAFLYLVVSGEVALEMETAYEPVLIQRIHTGEAIGWSALTAGSRTHFQARALTPVTTIAFPADRLRDACERDPEMGYALMKRLLELVTERLDAIRLQVLKLGPQAEVAVES